MNSSMAERRPENLNRRATSRGVAVSTGWSVLLLLAAWLIFYQLRTIHEFESGGQFEAHNRIHWFRPIAVFWFERYSILPSVILALLVFARHAVSRGRTVVTVVLALL